MERSYKRATGDPPFLVQTECDSSPFDQQSNKGSLHGNSTCLCGNTDFFYISK